MKGSTLLPYVCIQMAQLMQLESRQANMVRSLGEECGAVAILGAGGKQVPSLKFASYSSDSFIPVLDH